MGFKDERSILKTKTIKNVLLNKKDYKFLDFSFKFKKAEKGSFWECDEIEVYNFDTLILKIKIREIGALKVEKRFQHFNVNYFNPQTNNDILSINHIIAVFSGLIIESEGQKDNGNADVINNQFSLPFSLPIYNQPPTPSFINFKRNYLGSAIFNYLTFRFSIFLV